MKKLNQFEVDKILKSHEIWLFDKNIGSAAEFVENDLTNIDFSGKNLSNITFRKCNLTFINFADTICNNTIFTGITINGCKFDGTTINGGYFNHCIIKNTTWDESVLENVWFKNTSINKAEFNYATFKFVKFIRSNLQDIECTDTKSSNVYFIDSSCVYVQFLGGEIKNCKYFNTEWTRSSRFEDIKEAELNNLYVYCKLCKSKLCMKYDDLKKDLSKECPVIEEIVKSNMVKEDNTIKEITASLNMLFNDAVPELYLYFESISNREDCIICKTKPCNSCDNEILKFYHNATNTDFRLLEESQDIINDIKHKSDRYGICNIISVLDYAFTKAFNLKFENEDENKKFYIKVINNIIKIVDDNNKIADYENRNKPNENPLK